MEIHGFNKTTLLDYPEHLASTIFTGGCNFRCPFCHNASLVTNPLSQPLIAEEAIFSVLEKRSHFLEGVCITGGEPTLSKELPEFIRKIKNIGLKVKLDTNGTSPHILKELINNHLVDYIAMDIKNSKKHYSISIGINNYDPSCICESVDIIMCSDIVYEFRTTVVKEHHTRDDFIDIGKWISGAKAYFIQTFKNSGDLICDNLSGFSKTEMTEFKKILLPYVEYVDIRGID